MEADLEQWKTVDEADKAEKPLLSYKPFEPDVGNCELSDPECAYLYVY